MAPGEGWEIAPLPDFNGHFKPFGQLSVDSHRAHWLAVQVF